MIIFLLNATLTARTPYNTIRNKNNMDFTNETQTVTFFTAHPEPFHIFWMIVVFVLNFMIARFVSIQLVKAGYVKKYTSVILITKKGRMKYSILTQDYKKLFLFWFVPIVGAAGLIALYITCSSARSLVLIKRKLFLNHI